MTKSPLLSSEEVEAILKVSQEQPNDLSEILGGDHSEQHDDTNLHTLSNITELTRTEFEKIFSSFLRKKVVVKPGSFRAEKLSDCLSEAKDKSVFTVFRVAPNEHYGMFAISLPLLHHMINLIYGGTINNNDKIITNPGKVGLIVAEKICQLFLASFAEVCQEYDAISYELIKTSASANITFSLNLENEIYSAEYAICFDDVETNLKFMISKSFINDFNVKHDKKGVHDNRFWQTAIKSQVVDSYVNISVAMPEVNMKVKDFMDLKDGDIIPIGDPTMVYLCLNNLKLFRGVAGQANNKLVVKILNQI
jgi:flagellar motor switch protein FliM